MWLMPASASATPFIESGFLKTSEALVASATPAPERAAVLADTCILRYFMVTAPASTFQCSPAKAREQATRLKAWIFLFMPYKIQNFEIILLVDYNELLQNYSSHETQASLPPQTEWRQRPPSSKNGHNSCHLPWQHHPSQSRPQRRSP